MRKHPQQNRVKKPVKLHFMREDAPTDDDMSGIFIDESDVLLLYHALKQYEPTSDTEAHLSETLLETFEEMIVNDFNIDEKEL